MEVSKMTIDMFATGALIWIPSNTRRWVNDKEQLQIFPTSLSMTKVPMLGIFKGYSWNGECEVLCADGVWSFEQGDLKRYQGAREINRC
jgi:hypothetical protein